MASEEEPGRPDNFASNNTYFVVWIGGGVNLGFWDGKAEGNAPTLETARYVINFSAYQALLVSAVLQRKALQILTEVGPEALHRTTAGEGRTTETTGQAPYSGSGPAPGPGDGLDLWRQQLGDLDPGKLDPDAGDSSA